MIKKLFQRIGNSFHENDKFPVDIKSLENKISYTFRNKNLLLQALKHRSYLGLTRESDSQSNERLEFLGDAVLDLIITEHLYNHYKSRNEGFLSKKKSILVSRQVLGYIMDDLDFGKYLLINKGEEKTGGRTRQSNLANLFEAILGAIYLDSNYEVAQKFVKRFLLAHRDEFLAKTIYFNYKSSLLEYSQARGWGYPKYHIDEESGPDHNKEFIVVVNVNKRWSAKGMGRSKKKAEQIAARNLLRKIKQSKSNISIPHSEE